MLAVIGRVLLDAPTHVKIKNWPLSLSSRFHCTDQASAGHNFHTWFGFSLEATADGKRRGCLCLSVYA